MSKAFNPIRKSAKPFFNDFLPPNDDNFFHFLFRKLDFFLVKFVVSYKTKVTAFLKTVQIMSDVENPKIAQIKLNCASSLI